MIYSMDSVAGYTGFETRGFCGAKLIKKSSILDVELYDDEIGNFLIRFSGVKKIVFNDFNLCSAHFAMYACEVVDLGETEELQFVARKITRKNINPKKIRHYRIFLPNIGVYEIFSETVNDISGEAYGKQE